MARGRNAKKEAQAKETRIRILRAAVKLFARQGYHKTTIADLAHAIHLTSGAIFHHFATKEALLEAVVEWLARGIRSYSDFTDQVQAGSLEAIEKILILMCDHYKRNPEATICLAALATEFAGSSHPMASHVESVYDVFVDSFERLLSNHPKVVDPKAAAISFVGAVQGIAIQGLLREKDQSIDRLAGAFVTMLADW